MTEMTRFECSICGGYLNVREELKEKYLGKSAPCPDCGEPIYFFNDPGEQDLNMVLPDNGSSFGNGNAETSAASPHVPSLTLTNVLLGVGVLFFFSNLIVTVTSNNQRSVEFTTIHKEFTKLQLNTSAIKYDVSRIKRDVSDIDSDVSGIDSAVSAIRSDVSDIDSDVSAISSRVGDFDRRGVKIRN